MKLNRMTGLAPFRRAHCGKSSDNRQQCRSGQTWNPRGCLCLDHHSFLGLDHPDSLTSDNLSFPGLRPDSFVVSGLSDSLIHVRGGCYRNNHVHSVIENIRAGGGGRSVEAFV